jgi:hypothetical protein
MMAPLAADWATIDWVTVSSLATAAGTLILAIATFSAVRSSNRSARVAEMALQEQRRPLLAASRLEDPTQKIMFMEGNWVSASGGRGVVEHDDGIVYMAISLRNVGSGIAVCQGWAVVTGSGPSLARTIHTPLDQFRLQSRDLYIPNGDIGMWQGALRNPADPIRAAVAEAVAAGEMFTVELLYSDQVGRQRTISRFSLIPVQGTWLASLVRHWYLDWDGPRPESTSMAAAEALLRDRDAADERRAALERSDDPEEDDPGVADGPLSGSQLSDPAGP